MSDIDNITTSGEMPDTGSTPETTKDPPAPVQTPAEDPDPAAGEIAICDRGYRHLAE